LQRIPVSPFTGNTSTGLVGCRSENRNEQDICRLWNLGCCENAL